MTGLSVNFVAASATEATVSIRKTARSGRDNSGMAITLLKEEKGRAAQSI